MNCTGPSLPLHLPQAALVLVSMSGGSCPRVQDPKGYVVMLAFWMPSPRVPRHKVSLLQAWKVVTVLLSAIAATHWTSLALEVSQRPLLTLHVSSLSEQDFFGHLNVHSIKISINNLNNYLNYTGNFILGSIQNTSPTSSPLVPVHEKYPYLL